MFDWGSFIVIWNGFHCVVDLALDLVDAEIELVLRLTIVE